MFDDSFFDDFFGGVTEKPLTLHTDGAVVKIKPLPAQGRPADFSGAVGQFDVTSEASASTGTTGDPLTLTMNVTGRGNFDRVDQRPPASADWKSYKPNARFEPADRSNTSGTKIFEQSIVPAKAGVQEIPAVSFSYFDPEGGTYVTKGTEPIAVEISQGTAPGPGATKAASTPTEAPKTSPDGLVPDKPAPVRGTSSLRPLVLAPWSIVVNSAMLARLAIGGIVRAIRTRRPRPAAPAAKPPKGGPRILAAMDAALQAKDATRFSTPPAAPCRNGSPRNGRCRQSRDDPRDPHTPERPRRRSPHVFQTAARSLIGQRFTAPDLQQWRDSSKQLHQLAGHEPRKPTQPARL